MIFNYLVNSKITSDKLKCMVYMTTFHTLSFYSSCKGWSTIAIPPSEKEIPNNNNFRSASSFVKQISNITSKCIASIHTDTYFKSSYNPIQYNLHLRISRILQRPSSNGGHKENLSPEICGPYKLKHYLSSRNSDYLNEIIAGPKTAIKYRYSSWDVQIMHREFFP